MDEPASCKIFIKGLPNETDKDEVVELLRSLYSNVVITNVMFGKSKRTDFKHTAMAFVDVETDNQRNLLIQNFQKIPRDQRSKFPNKLIASTNVAVTYCFDKPGKGKTRNLAESGSHETSGQLLKENIQTSCNNLSEKKIPEKLGKRAFEANVHLSKEVVEGLYNLYLEKQKVSVISNDLRLEISKLENSLKNQLEKHCSNLFVSELELLNLELKLFDKTRESNEKKLKLAEAKKELKDVRDGCNLLK